MAVQDIASAGRVGGFFYEGHESDSGEKLKYRQRMCLEVARNFTQIENKIHQEALSHLARALAVK